MSHVLVVEDSRTQALDIQLLLEEAGMAVALAGHGREAVERLARSTPDVVLTDMAMPEMNGLELVEAVRRDRPEVPVVLMTAQGSEELAAEALRRGAVSYVPKRNLARDIVPTLEKILAVARSARDQQQVFGCLNDVELGFELDNDVRLVTPLIGHLEEHLARLQAPDRVEAMHVGVALHEALLNAIQHGNLEAGSELRQGDEAVFHDLCERRRREAPYRDRRVRVRARISRQEAVYTVADDGPGFDPSALPDPTDPANLDRIGGRGLLLIRTFMDQVRHNATGNEVVLVKRARRPV
jgi:CheY-like chemotaxis protein